MNLLGLLVAEGGMTSHIAIVARALGVPAVLGIPPKVEVFKGISTVALNGGDGYAILNPDDATVREFDGKRSAIETEKASLESFKIIEPVTANGTRIEVAANLGSEAEINNALISGAMGVGLFRTELMFTGARRLPSEERQYEVYSKLVTSFAPYAVVIRTLDVGGDKPLPRGQSGKGGKPLPWLARHPDVPGPAQPLQAAASCAPAHGDQGQAEGHVPDDFGRLRGSGSQGDDGRMQPGTDGGRHRLGDAQIGIMVRRRLPLSVPPTWRKRSNSSRSARTT